MIDIDDNFPLNPAQKLQVHSARTGEITWNSGEVGYFIKRFKYPLYFLDFESFQPAIPLFNGTRPYQQIPFQYSLHVLESEGGRLIHKEFLAKAGPDPRPEFAKHLVSDLGESGSIVVYNRSFERRILDDISQDFPAYSEKMRLYVSRMKDLMEPFKRKMIYKPQMKGSYSIKNVYPAMVQGAGYEDLDIADGGSASLAYESLIEEPDLSVIEKTRKNLLAYCCMDTLAMVEIWKVISSRS
jgi:hypothetical protein